MSVLKCSAVSDPLILKVLRIVRQLLPIDDLDELLKAGVELPRSVLGVERCALWLLNHDGESFRGTWGTDIYGRTSDERSQSCTVKDLEKTLATPFQQLEGWVVRQDESRLTWTPEGKRVEGSGWNTVIPLTGPEGNVGAFFQDAAISNSPLNPHLQDVMSIYCSLLGQLAGRRLAEKREFFLSHGLEELLLAADELMTFDDIDLLHRRIVELARQRLGVIRCGLFIACPHDPNKFLGTWGTDWDGNTTDEHSGSFTFKDRPEEMGNPLVTEFTARRWTAKNPFRMSWFEKDGTRIDYMEGWNALHPISVKDRTIGYLCSDPGKSFEPLDPRKMDLLSTYCDLAARILDRHQSQTHLREAMNAAEQATKAKSEFLASMSHEIRTPLAGVLGMLRIALRDPSIPDPSRNLLHKALGNAESLLGIINDILDYSKIEAGKLSLETIDFCLPDLLENCLSIFADMAASRNLSFLLSVSPEVPRHLLGDPTRIRQILQNLVGNALKFTEQGSVDVRVDLVESNDDLHLVRFAVSDTGIGITEDVLPKLFSKFEQADMSTTRRFGGTGLGLAISKQLAEALGGSIEARSVAGQGTSFFLLLPMRTGSKTDSLHGPDLQPHTHRLRVLCAEDYPTTQIIVRTLLEDLGHSVVMVENGIEALRHLACEDFDVVLMDGRMPLMDGIEAIGHLRRGQMGDQVFRDPKIHTIALTANVSVEDRERFLQAGVDHFLAKPLDETEFHLALETAIRRQLEAGRPLQPLVHATPSTLDAMFEVDGQARPETSPPPSATVEPLEERLKNTFRDGLPQRIAELVAALDRNDCQTCGRLLHGLRGAAGYVKDPFLTELAHEMERFADQGEMARLQELMPRLRTGLDRWSRPQENP